LFLPAALRGRNSKSIVTNASPPSVNPFMRDITMKQWYEALFENYGLTYDKECFAQGTVGECDFIENEIGFNATSAITSHQK